MSQYFSRLAQRSGVSDAPAPSALSAPSVRTAALPGVDTWPETATETVALGAPASGGNWLPDAEDFAQPAFVNSLPDAASPASSVMPDNAPAADASTAGNLITRTSANSTQDGAQFLAHVRAVSEQWRGNRAPGESQASPVVAMPPSDNAAPRTSDPIGTMAPAADAGIASVSTAPLAHRVNDGSSKAALPATTPQRSSISTVDSTAVTTTSRHIDALPPLRDRAAGERVSAQSPPPPAPTVQWPTAAAPPSVQVHIGRIEIEVHAPAATTPLPTPMAAPASSPAHARDAGFSLHRHYLRGR